MEESAGKLGGRQCHNVQGARSVVLGFSLFNLKPICSIYFLWILFWLDITLFDFAENKSRMLHRSAAHSKSHYRYKDTNGIWQRIRETGKENAKHDTVSAGGPNWPQPVDQHQ